MTSGVSQQTGTVDFVFLIIVGVSVFFLVLITFLMIYFIFKYNKKRHTTPKNIEGNTTLEVIWTVIPTIIVLILFYFGWKGFEFLRSVPENALNVNVTARMWSWSFEYDNGVKTDTLVVPVDRPVKLNLSSQDVIHSFYVPAFRIKEDAVPGFDTYMWFEANETGNYDVLCAEYCGLQHAYMLTKIKVLPEAEYQNWLVAQPVSASAGDDLTKTEDSGEPAAEAGIANAQKIIQQLGCVACHSSDGSQMIGPSFKGSFGAERTIVVDGETKTVTVDENYLRTAILEPGLEVVEGYDAIMPSQAEQITEQELVAIIQYIKEL